MHTTIQKMFPEPHPTIDSVFIAGRSVREVFKWMQFKAMNGKTYDVWNVYAIDVPDLSMNWVPAPTKKQVRISVSAAEWWYPEDVINWLPHTVGEGMPVITELGPGVVSHLLPNRTAFVDIPGHGTKPFREDQLKN